MTRLALACLLLALASAPASAQDRSLGVEAGSRVALVIGNAEYEHATSLRNPTNDAEDMAAALERSGFSVVLGTDLSYEGMTEIVAEFAHAAEAADVAAVYYAGHGVQVQGANYLIPVDARVLVESQIRTRSIALDEVMGALDATRARLKLVLLDACRDNPFQISRSGGGGWSTNMTPSGSVIAFATAQGAKAADNAAQRNGLYTQALLAEMEKPGVELSVLLRRARQAVRRASAGEQEPVSVMGYDGDFYFVQPDGTAPAPTPVVEPPAPSVSPAAAAGLDASVDALLPLRRPEDYAAALPALRDAAAAGHAEAQSILGYMFLTGTGVEADPDNAIVWLEQAAALGHAAAQTNLGILLEEGTAGDPDPARAAELYRAAANAGRPVAMNNLGALYQNGEGVEQDHERAVALYRQAAEAGLTVARGNLGTMLQEGLGTPADEAEAARQYRLAADVGHVPSMTRLGILRLQGRETVRDLDEAERWLRRASDAGSETAQRALVELAAARARRAADEPAAEAPAATEAPAAEDE